MQSPDPGRDAMHRCSASAAFPLTLLLLTALLSGAGVLPWASAMAETAEQPDQQISPNISFWPFEPFALCTFWLYCSYELPGPIGMSRSRF